MQLRTVVCAALWAALLISEAAPGYARPRHAHPRIALVAHDNVALRTNPRGNAPIIVRLIQQTQVEILKRRQHWDYVSLWDSVHGWISRVHLTFRRPWASTSTYRAPEIHSHISAHAPQNITATGVVLGSTGLYRLPGGQRVTSLPSGTRASIHGWRQDVAGHIWYQVGKLWARGDAIQFAWAHPPATVPSGITRPIRGKGMWLTLGPIAAATPDAILNTAKHNGITHLYLESAISPLGFHGRGSVGPLIDAARRRHIAVLAWVYPYLSDIAADVDLTRKVFAFRTPSGNGFDGIAADLERNIRLDTVRQYSQIVRSYVGSKYLLVGVTYPPQSVPDFPYAEVSHDYDVIAPMDYWHQTKGAVGPAYGGMRYGSSYGSTYATESIRAIRASGARVPIAPIGQTFDDFGRLEMGPYAPSAAEVRGFLIGCKANGAIGVSFFQWMTATIPEWRAIGSFRY